MRNDSLDREISYIADPKIKAFTYEISRKAPPYFWTIPASSTGKYHPADENGDGGTVLHTKRMVRIAEDLCRFYDISGEDRDCVIAAGIMHDMVKNGYPLDSGHTVSGHGPLWISLAMSKEKYNDFLNVGWMKKISYLIGCHMGRFDMPYVTSGDRLLVIIQLADYISSRNYIKTDV